MRRYLLRRIVRDGASWYRGSHIPKLTLIAAIMVSIIILSGCTASSESTSFTTSSSIVCQSCHGTGEVAYIAEEKLPDEEEQCVLPLNVQRDRHKDLLNDWKKSVVREGNSIYVTSDGREFEMSLTGTCMSCHTNKTEFCDKCHSLAAVSPDCWSCHKLLEEDL